VEAGAELLDREQEVAEISALLEAARSGAGSVLVIEGPPGIGKTELVRRTRALARERGFSALSATGAEVERDFVYGVVRQLFEQPLAQASTEQRASLLSGAASLARIAFESVPGPLEAPTGGLVGSDAGASGAARAAAVGRGAATATGDPSFPVLHGLYWLCANLAARAPVLVAVDDAHWADSASVRFLLHLVRRIGELPVLVVMSLRPDELDSVPLADIARAPGTCVIRPNPLGPEAAGRLVCSFFERAAEEGFCRACHAATGGNPFLLRELVRALRRQGVRPVAGEVAGVGKMGPPAVARAVVARLEHCSPAALALARAVALLGPGAELRHAAALGDLELSLAADAADRLAGAEILRPGRPLEFVHPVVRAAVYADIPTAARALGHRRAGRLLAAEQAPPERVAAHLLASEPEADTWTVDTLRRAAQQALGRGAPESAILYLRRALAEPPPAGDRACVAAELGAAELLVNPLVAAEHLGQALDLHEHPAERARTALQLLRALLATDRVSEAAEVVRASVRDLGGRDPELALQLEAELITTLRQGLAKSPLDDERLEQWKGQVEGRSPAERLLLVTLAAHAGLTGSDAATVANLAARALGDGRLLQEQSADSLASYLPFYQLLCTDQRFDLVERGLEDALAQARERGSLVAFAYASLFRSLLACARGELKDAEADAWQSLEVPTRQPGVRFLVTVIAAALLDVLLERGGWEEAEATLQQYGLDAELHDSVLSRLLLASRGHLRLAEGRTREGVADLLELIDREERQGAANLCLTPYRSLAALGLHRLGEGQRALALSEDALAWARAWGAPRPLGTALRHAGLVRGADGGLDLLREAVQVLEPSPSRLAQAWAFTDLGSALRRAGRRSEAVDTLRRGLDLAHRCGAHPLAARARDELAVAGARPRRHALTGADALTPSERRVCQLAAQGLANRDVAQALFVTTRTVEVHLTHSYQKLGITSREELAGVLTVP
jgi:DNA-binding CsgD family transcriptional regulator